MAAENAISGFARFKTHNLYPCSDVSGQNFQRRELPSALVEPKLAADAQGNKFSYRPTYTLAL